MLDINKRIELLESISSNELKKEAGMFSAITSIISSVFSDVFNINDISGSLMRIATTAVMGYFFGIWWSIATAILQYGFGIDIEVILNTIVSVLSKFISTVFNSNKQDEIDVDKASEQLADEVMKTSNVSGPTLEEPIGNIITANKKESLIKEAGIGSKLFGSSLKAFMTTSSGGFLKKLIGTIIKGLLVGSGIGVGTAAAMRSIKPGQHASSETIALPEISLNRKDRHPKETKKNTSKSLRSYMGPPSGEGKSYHLNDADENSEGQEAWFIPNKTSDFGRTIYNWIFAVYPDISNSAETILYDNFMKVYNSIKRDFNRYNKNMELYTNGAYVRIPKTINGKRIHTVKDIVDIILDSIRV